VTTKGRREKVGTEVSGNVKKRKLKGNDEVRGAEMVERKKRGTPRRKKNLPSYGYVLGGKRLRVGPANRRWEEKSCRLKSAGDKKPSLCGGPVGR